MDKKINQEIDKIHEEGVYEFGTLWFIANRNAVRVAMGMDQYGEEIKYEDPFMTLFISKLVLSQLRLEKNDNNIRSEVR